MIDHDRSSSSLSLLAESYNGKQYELSSDVTNWVNSDIKCLDVAALIIDKFSLDPNKHPEFIPAGLVSVLSGLDITIAIDTCIIIGIGATICGELQDGTKLLLSFDTVRYKNNFRNNMNNNNGGDDGNNDKYNNDSNDNDSIESDDENEVLKPINFEETNMGKAVRTNLLSMGADNLKMDESINKFPMLKFADRLYLFPFPFLPLWLSKTVRCYKRGGLEQMLSSSSSPFRSNITFPYSSTSVVRSMEYIDSFK